MQDSRDVKKELLKLISIGHTSKAIDLLKMHFESTQSEKINQLVVISGKYADLSKDHINDTILRNHYTVSLNQIHESLIALFDAREKAGPYKISSWYFYLITAFSVFALFIFPIKNPLNTRSNNPIEISPDTSIIVDYPLFPKVFQNAYETTSKQESRIAGYATIELQKESSKISSLIESGDTIKESDNYRIHIFSEKVCYMYIFQIDSRGQLFWIFPKNSGNIEFSSGSNPIASKSWNSIPGSKEWYQLDDKKGVEHIYIVQSIDKLNGLENALFQASQSINSPRMISEPLKIKTKGIRKIVQESQNSRSILLPLHKQTIDSMINSIDGILVIEKWFYHEND